jgi:pectin methylesterase-like acyl-CoA thioesterase
MYSRRVVPGLHAWIFILLLHFVSAETSKYSACQAPTANPLDGCPPNTILVSQTDCVVSFTTIQRAISSTTDDTTSYTILVLPGDYIEQLNVTRSGPLTILGQTNTLNEQSGNSVTVYWASANSNSRYTDNAFTSVLTVAPNLNASLTGSGPTGFQVPDDSRFIRSVHCHVLANTVPLKVMQTPKRVLWSWEIMKLS